MYFDERVETEQDRVLFDNFVRRVREAFRASGVSVSRRKNRTTKRRDMNQEEFTTTTGERPDGDTSEVKLWVRRGWFFHAQRGAHGHCVLWSTDGCGVLSGEGDAGSFQRSSKNLL